MRHETVVHACSRSPNCLIFTATGNTGCGSGELLNGTTGDYNTATGFEALYANTTGSANTAAAYTALYSNTTGIANIGAPNTQTSTYIAGISNAHVTGSAVYFSASGKLGVLASSERYKMAIAPMGADSEKLRRSRPVSFHLKADPHGALRYGLLAEEVDHVFPELVIRDDMGKIQGVRYGELAPILLNEVQRRRPRMIVFPGAESCRGSSPRPTAVGPLEPF